MTEEKYINKIDKQIKNIFLEIIGMLSCVPKGTHSESPHPLNICKCMHLHIFRDEFSRLNRENFHCIAMKSLVKIYANACICIYFKRADGVIQS